MSEQNADTLNKKSIIYESGKIKDTLYLNNKKSNHVVLGSVFEPYKSIKNKIWYRNNFDQEWINWCATTTVNESRFFIRDTLNNGSVYRFHEDNLYMEIPCVNLEMSFAKEKINLKLHEPKKRKLNKIRFVKEDQYSYPQSNISELFSSLIKAFESDDHLYALKYLLAYKKNEFDLIIEEFNVEGKIIKLPIEEKNRIILKLKTIQEKLDVSELKKVNNKYFELSVDDAIYNLAVDNSLWKLNPYAHGLYK